jgi:hypothetical protein
VQVISPGHYLRPLLAPSRFRLDRRLGKKPNRWAASSNQNLLAGGFKGGLYAVNPNHATILGPAAFPSLTAIGKRWTWPRLRAAGRRAGASRRNAPAGAWRRHSFRRADGEVR